MSLLRVFFQLRQNKCLEKALYVSGKKLKKPEGKEADSKRKSVGSWKDEEKLKMLNDGTTNAMMSENSSEQATLNNITFSLGKVMVVNLWSCIRVFVCRKWNLDIGCFWQSGRFADRCSDVWKKSWCRSWQLVGGYRGISRWLKVWWIYMMTENVQSCQSLHVGHNLSHTSRLFCAIMTMMKSLRQDL